MKFHSQLNWLSSRRAALAELCQARIRPKFKPCHCKSASTTQNAAAWPRLVPASDGGWMLLHCKHHSAVLLGMAMATCVPECLCELLGNDGHCSLHSPAQGDGCPVPLWEIKGRWSFPAQATSASLLTNSSARQFSLSAESTGLHPAPASILQPSRGCSQRSAHPAWPGLMV